MDELTRGRLRIADESGWNWFTDLFEILPELMAKIGVHDNYEGSAGLFRLALARDRTESGDGGLPAL